MSLTYIRCISPAPRRQRELADEAIEAAQAELAKEPFKVRFKNGDAVVLPDDAWIPLLSERPDGVDLKALVEEHATGGPSMEAWRSHQRRLTFLGLSPGDAAE